MIVCLGTYTRSLTEADGDTIARHRSYLDDLYKQGLLIASGPRQPRIGGLIIARGNDEEAVHALLDNDPFVVAGIADYELIPFEPSKAAHPDMVEN